MHDAQRYLNASSAMKQPTSCLAGGRSSCRVAFPVRYGMILTSKHICTLPNATRSHLPRDARDGCFLHKMKA